MDRIAPALRPEALPDETLAKAAAGLEAQLCLGLQHQRKDRSGESGGRRRLGAIMQLAQILWMESSHNNSSAPPRLSDSAERRLEARLFASLWLMTPFYLGLVVALGLSVGQAYAQVVVAREIVNVASGLRVDVIGASTAW